MRKSLRLCSILLLLAAGVSKAQTPAAAPAKLTFDVATIKPSPPPDIAKIQAEVQAGRMPKFGPHVEDSRAEYTYMSLKDLIGMAYKVKPYQITGPDWMATERFDIVAKFPEGATKDDAPAMLQALLEERFKLAAHRETKDNPVLALIVGKGGPKLKEATSPAVALDEAAPLKPGEMKIDTPDGPARMTRNPDGTGTVNMGVRGTFIQRVDGPSQTLRIEGTNLTMAGFADMLTQVTQMGGGGSRPVIDMTGLKGNYQVAVELSLADLMANARAQGINMPGGPGGAPAAGVASDPAGGGSSIYSSVQALGLKLEQRKAPTEQLIVEHVEKAPTDN